MRRLLLLIAGSLILLAVAVPTAGLYYLTCTESGFRFLIGRIPHSVAGVQIDVVNPGGTLAHGIRVERLEIDHHLVHLRFDGIDGRMELLPLLLQTIRTKDAFIRSVSVQLKRRTKPPTTSQALFLPQWLIVSAERAHVGSVVITLASGARWEASDIRASGIARHRTIRFFEAALRTGDAQFEATGQLRAADPLQIDATGQIRWTPPGQAAWSLNGTANGDLNSLAVTAHTSAPFRSDFSGRALALTGQWHWMGSANVHDLDIAAWGGSAAVLGLLSGNLEVRGSQDGFAARGPVMSTGLSVGAFDSEFEGAYSSRTLWIKHVGITHRQSRAHVTGRGTIAVVQDGPRLDLHGGWQDFRWPLIGGSAPFHSGSGDFVLSGIWPYSVHLAGVASVRDLPQIPAVVDGTLAKDRFSFDKAELDLAGGRATLTGAVVWAPSRSWTVSGEMRDIDPGQFRSDLPGKVSFSLAAQGNGFDAGNDFSLGIHDIGGRLRGVAATGGGDFTRTDKTWKFDNVRVGLGRSHLALDGRVNHAFDLRFALTTEDLSLLAPDSRGQLDAHGTIRGTLEAPSVSAAARGNGLRHDGMALDDFDVLVDFNASSDYESNIRASFHNLTYQHRRLDSLTLRLAGRPADYSVRLEAVALGMAASLRGSGPFADGIWQGRLEAVNVTGTEALHLGLQRPVPLLVSAAAVSASGVCLAGEPASLCTDADWSSSHWSATFTANQMPLSTLTAGLTQAVEYGGRINVHGRLFGSGGDPAQGAVQLDLIDAVLSHRLSSGRIEHTSIGSGAVAVTASRAAVETQIGLESGDVGTIKGRVTIERGAAAWQQMPIRGELHAHTEQLGLITLYVPEIDRAAGQLDADMRIAGTLGTPFVNGSLRITDGEIDYYQVNLGMRAVAFDARLSDNGVDLGGSVRIGAGTAQAQGRLEWRDSLPYGKVHIEGSNLRVVDVPEAQIDASPDLDFTVRGHVIQAAGTVKIPVGKIVPKDLTGAVVASSDEVLVGQAPTDPSQRFEVLSTITLALGDHVSIDTAGLTGRLTGNMTVRSGYEAITSATGELSIEQGKYTAYARKLDIQRGRLIFTGGPIGNPGIDIRAIKEFPDVTAGVNVRGTLLQPRISFFSDPSLTQSQIASLILAGGSLESAQTRQGNEVLAQGGAILAQQLGSRVGIEDVSLESDLTNETSLVLGRYLSPRLYVSYGVALTEQLNVLKLRYSLGNRWTVKTEVGQARGADLVYTIER